MEFIKLISQSPGVALYSLNYDDNGKMCIDERLSRYIASTSQIRQVTTQAEVVSPQFENLLQQGIGAAISRSELVDIIYDTLNGSNWADILFILRGGLNFDPTTGLGEIGIRTVKHYISSQRKRVPSENPENDEWEIIQGNYKKLFEAEHKPRKIDLFAGDIVATGTSLKHGLEEYFTEAGNLGNKLNSLTFFSIGSKKTEDIIIEVLTNNKFEQLFTENFRANIVYLEGRFGLAKKTTNLKIKNPDTDILTSLEGAICSPDFVRELLIRPEYILEPCVIYDGGKRRNACNAHFSEVIEYWEKLKQLAKEGLKFQDAINERYPLVHVSKVVEWRELHPSWRYILDSVIEDIIKEKYFLLAGCINSSEALEELCERRIREISEKREGTTAGTMTTAESEKKATHHIGMTTSFMEKDIPTTILISGEPERTNKIYSMLDLPVRHIKTGRGLPIGKGYLIRMIDGKEHRIPVVAATSGMGFGSAEIVLMELIDTYINSLNIDNTKDNKCPINIIRIGTCGSHQPDIYGGDLIVTTETYVPFGCVSDLIETKNDKISHNLYISLLLSMEKLLNIFSRVTSIDTKDISDKVKYEISKNEVLSSYSCDREIVRYILETAERLGFDVTMTHEGPVFSKLTLFSESYKTFGVEPEGIRKTRLDYRSKVMHEVGMYGSEMEMGLITAIAHLAKLKGYNIKVGGVMAVVNNPRDPDRSENLLFADPMTISMAVDRVILLGLETAVEIYKQQYFDLKRRY